MISRSQCWYELQRCERGYHVFYFLITHVVDLHESCQLSDNIYGKDSVDKTSNNDLPRWQIILPAASARSRLSPLMTKKKCRSWTKPSTSLDSSGAYNWSSKWKWNNSQLCRDEKIDVYRVTSCCMVLSQLEFQVHGGTQPISKNQAKPPGHGRGCFAQIAGWWRENQLYPQLLRQRRRHLWRFHQP